MAFQSDYELKETKRVFNLTDLETDNIEKQATLSLWEKAQNNLKLRLEGINKRWLSPTEERLIF